MVFFWFHIPVLLQSSYFHTYANIFFSLSFSSIQFFFSVTSQLHFLFPPLLSVLNIPYAHKTSIASNSLSIKLTVFAFIHLSHVRTPPYSDAFALHAEFTPEIIDVTQLVKAGMQITVASNLSFPGFLVLGQGTLLTPNEMTSFRVTLTQVYINFFPVLQHFHKSTISSIIKPYFHNSTHTFIIQDLVSII